MRAAGLQEHGGVEKLPVEQMADPVGGPSDVVLAVQASALPIAAATARRAGRTVGVVDVDMIDAQAKFVAVGRGTHGTTVG